MCHTEVESNEVHLLCTVHKYRFEVLVLHLSISIFCYFLLHFMNLVWLLCRFRFKIQINDEAGFHIKVPAEHKVTHMSSTSCGLKVIINN